MKLYNIYNVISNKTVRAHENFYKKYKRKNKNVLGTLVKTNRGFFLDGHQIDVASMLMWHKMNNDADLALQAAKDWDAYVESQKKETSNED